MSTRCRHGTGGVTVVVTQTTERHGCEMRYADSAETDASSSLSALVSSGSTACSRSLLLVKSSSACGIVSCEATHATHAVALVSRHYISFTLAPIDS